MMYTVLYSRVALSMVGAAAVALGLPRLGNPDLWQWFIKCQSFTVL